MQKSSPGFIKLKEFGRLTHSQQVQYVEFLRQAIMELASAERNIRGSKVATIFKKNQDFWSLLLGEEIYAATDYFTRGGVGTSGSCSPNTDNCIYGMNLQTYQQKSTDPTEAQRPQYDCNKAFRCKPPETCAVQGNSTGGFRCGFVGTGLMKDDPRNCVPRDYRKGISAQCNDLSNNFGSQVRAGGALTEAEIADALKREYREALKAHPRGGVCQGNLGKKFIKCLSDKFADRLAKSAWDADIFAYMMDLAARGQN